jgi:hypothetical protein
LVEVVEVLEALGTVMSHLGLAVEETAVVEMKLLSTQLRLLEL